MLISISLVAASETTIGIDDYSVESGNTVTAPIRINDTVMLGGGEINQRVVDMISSKASIT